MRFDYRCKKDKRVTELSPYALDYPRDVDKAPDSPGVYMFTGVLDEVLYVARTSGKTLKEEIKSKKGTPAEKDATKYRWFKTAGDDIARQLEDEWVKKFQPKNNQAAQPQPGAVQQGGA